MQFSALSETPLVWRNPFQAEQERQQLELALSDQKRLRLAGRVLLRALLLSVLLVLLLPWLVRLLSDMG